MFTRITTRTIIQSSSTPLLTTPLTSTSTSTSISTSIASSSSCTCSRSISTYIPDVRAVMLNPKPSTPTPIPSVGQPIISPSGYAISRKAAFKAAARRATSFYMDSVELARTRYPWMVTGVRQARPKIPIELRKPGPEYLMKQLRAEETTRVVKSYPRSIEKFRAGDKIAVVKKISLHAPKYDIITGTVIARWGGAGLSASFTVRNYHEGHGYELSYPLHSPFIQRIVVLEKGDERRKKIYEIRDAPREEIAVKPVTLEYLDNIHQLRRDIAEKKAVHKAFDISYQQQQNAAELQRLTAELKEKLKPWATSQNLSDIPIAPAPIKHKTAEQEALEKTMAETVSRMKKASKKGAATTTSTHGKDKSK